MLKTETRHAIDPATAKALDTDALRAHVQVGGLFAVGEIRLVFSHYDRLILGSAVPDGKGLTLDRIAETGTPSILDRREMGVLNIGDAGTISLGGTEHTLEPGEVLYVGRGAGPVTFAGIGRFHILSTSAHQTHPTRRITLSVARRVERGAPETANERVIIQFLHPKVCQTCQLLLGHTQFAKGSVWNTMLAHIQDRRMEANLSFRLPENQRIVHLMGEPTLTRHIVLADVEAVISPPWSIHAGAGTAFYTFSWAMAGDNVDFTDTDMIPMEALR